MHIGILFLVDSILYCIYFTLTFRLKVVSLMNCLVGNNRGEVEGRGSYLGARNQ